MLSASVGGLAGAALGTEAVAQDGAGGLWLVELFTSQGCSSCPAADRLLGELTRRPELLALSFHVDYWDYIGWKDPFASPIHTQRQHHYAKALRQRYVYTPEMVFHGLLHDPGRERAQISRLLQQVRDEVKKEGLPRINPTLGRSNGGITVSLPTAKLDREAELWVVTFDPEHRTKVPRGENAGTVLTNYNVVRSCERIAGWDGKGRSWSLTAEQISAARHVAILVQYEACGAVLGVARTTM